VGCSQFNGLAPIEEITPEEAAEIRKARTEIEVGKGIKAEDVWRELDLSTSLA
jgi:hypothetical protein